MPIKKITTEADKPAKKLIKKDKPVISAVKKIVVKPVKIGKIEKKPVEDVFIPEPVIQAASEIEIIDGEDFIMPAIMKGVPSRYIESVGRRKTATGLGRL